jgi:geranylgeranyl pyrophosphate synthase
MIMNKAFKGLSDGVEGAEQLVQGFIDDYYSSIRDTKIILSLDSYCDRFRKQMAIWFIVPVLLSKKIASDEKFTDAIQRAYGSFGIAWRLIDDIKDIKADMKKGAHSCIYFCLSEDIKDLWDKQSKEKIDKTNEGLKVIWDYVQENSVIDVIKERICDELESAAFTAQSYNMKGLADEFRCLLSPLKNKSAQL